MPKKELSLDQLGIHDGDPVWFRDEKGAKFIFTVKSLYIKSNGQPMATLSCRKAWGEEQYALPALLLEKVPQEVLDKIAQAREAKKAAEAEQATRGERPERSERPERPERPALDQEKPGRPRKFNFDRR
ncbi:hypothetical protein GlitD10_2256 [Gloeomargarita lithophora Alchichica-D10]|uniref:Uncharacterized protein n=1 Tax=Gloeomargarita lithophora Alchichica-D10 TaxID=1188229 RepID=A0A1J0AF70_9CYAN|nr:hypothetical protein [Gloeomargarita lithophora]APB34588.1 hypothetical protein GlitD10_2256 [Gloeomargarita lithophora Alchichica-D10]